MGEKPDTVHGRLLEATHISGYSFERACNELKWLLDDDRWKQCGKGYEQIDQFLASINFKEFKIAIEQRKFLVNKMTIMRATQKAIATTLGVSEITIARDKGKPRGTTNVEKNKIKSIEDKELETEDMTNVVPKIVTKSGAEIIEIAEKKVNLEGTLGSKGFECYTPFEYVESARKVMGGIDLDPASSPKANETIKAKKYYTLDDDGLSREWSGKIWLNPPYGRSLTSNFVEYALGQYDKGKIEVAILLLNAYGFDAKWFQDLFNHIICFTDHRIKFYGGSPTFGSVFVYLGNNKELFAKTFSQYGIVMEKYKYE